MYSTKGFLTPSPSKKTTDSVDSMYGAPTSNIGTEKLVHSVGWMEKWRMEGWKEGRMDGQMDRQTDGWMKGQREGGEIHSLVWRASFSYIATLLTCGPPLSSTGTWPCSEGPRTAHPG